MMMGDNLFWNNACLRGYYVYKDIWEATLDDKLAHVLEHENSHNRYAVAVSRKSWNSHWPFTTAVRCLGHYF